MASPKGGAGKSTCAVLLATEFARMGASVTILDCDPNKSLTRWASRGLPEGLSLLSDVQRSELVTSIREADGAGVPHCTGNLAIRARRYPGRNVPIRSD